MIEGWMYHAVIMKMKPHDGNDSFSSVVACFHEPLAAESFKRHMERVKHFNPIYQFSVVGIEMNVRTYAEDSVELVNNGAAIPDYTHEQIPGQHRYKKRSDYNEYNEHNEFNGYEEAVDNEFSRKKRIDFQRRKNYF